MQAMLPEGFPFHQFNYTVLSLSLEILYIVYSPSCKHASKPRMLRIYCKHYVSTRTQKRLNLWHLPLLLCVLSV